MNSNVRRHTKDLLGAAIQALASVIFIDQARALLICYRLSTSDIQRYEMIDAILLGSAAVVIGASAGFTVRYQRRNRGDERFHLGSWIAFVLNFVVIMAVARAANSIIQSGRLSDGWLVTTACAGVATMIIVGFRPVKKSSSPQSGGDDA